jgi:hypothetical protein
MISDPRPDCPARYGYASAACNVRAWSPAPSTRAAARRPLLAALGLHVRHDRTRPDFSPIATVSAMPTFEL